jgi:hypothetical protein
MKTEHYELNGCPVTVIHLQGEPHECSMCGAVGFHEHAVPWYCGPVMEGDSDGGYKTVCKKCHDRWASWNDSMQCQGT